jgi:hypothetical protein
MESEETDFHGRPHKDKGDNEILQKLTKQTQQPEAVR